MDFDDMLFLVVHAYYVSYVVFFSRQKEFVGIYNCCLWNYVYEFYEICTSKEDKRKHGIGLKNVQMILDKYQGIGMMRYEDGCFSYTVVIPEMKG